ncbi:MAG: hypothetical protein Q9160_007268 [Pyrenula sp. 1 TL-2023]
MPWPFTSTSSDDDRAARAARPYSSNQTRSTESSDSSRWPRLWPFTSKSSSNNENHSSKNATSSILSTITSQSPSSLQHSPQNFTFTPTQTGLLILLISTLSISTYRLRRYYFRHHPNASSLSPTFYSRRRSLPGLVTTVGDGDNFRLYHTPGGRLVGYQWLRARLRSENNVGYLRKWIWSSRKTEKRLKADETIHVRLAGVDAPELGHWGNPAQPGSKEALEWLKGFVLGRRVRVTALKPDQYNRVVGRVLIWRFPWVFGRKDVSLEMLKAGKAGIYEANTGVEFGGCEDQYRRAEEGAKRKGVGVWSKEMRGAETPREYKTRIKKEEEGGAAEKERGKEKVKQSGKMDTQRKKSGGLLNTLLSPFSSGGKR